MENLRARQSNVLVKVVVGWGIVHVRRRRRQLGRALLHLIETQRECKSVYARECVMESV